MSFGTVIEDILMRSRSIQDLAELPDQALVTLREYQIWNRLSPAGYYKRRAKKLVPTPLRLVDGNCRYTAEQMRSLVNSHEG